MVRRDDFVIGPREKAIEAIKAGKTEEALKYLNDVYEQFHTLHDGWANILSLLFAKLAEAYGEEWLEGFTREFMFAAYRPRFTSWNDMSLEQRVEMFCALHRAHYTEFHVEEDNEKFVVTVTGCNGGGRLIRDGIAKQQNAIVKKAYPWSFNRDDVPYYCLHAYFLNELWKEMGIKAEVRWGRQYDDQGNKIDEPCKYIVYK